MSRHVTYRGTTIDMEALNRENEKVPAIGNMKVNAKGDQINRGKVTRTADDIARDNHRVQSVVVSTGLKGKQPAAPDPVLEAPKPVKAVKPVEAPKVVKEVQLPNGDIVAGDTNAS